LVLPLCNLKIHKKKRIKKNKKNFLHFILHFSFLEEEKEKKKERNKLIHRTTTICSNMDNAQSSESEIKGSLDSIQVKDLQFQLNRLILTVHGYTRLPDLLDVKINFNFSALNDGHS
jgi:hypothetical protein